MFICLVGNQHGLDTSSLQWFTGSHRSPRDVRLCDASTIRPVHALSLSVTYWPCPSCGVGPAADLTPNWTPVSCQCRQRAGFDRPTELDISVSRLLSRLITQQRWSDQPHPVFPLPLLGNRPTGRHTSGPGCMMAFDERAGRRRGRLHVGRLPKLQRSISWGPLALFCST